MPGNFKNEDARVYKTNEALVQAMSRLLELRSFNKITVNDLCEEAQVGRTTFYSHFQDKYDLLKCWLVKTKPAIGTESGTNQYAEKKINDFVNSNEKRIRHLIEDADGETLGLLCNFMLSLLDMDKAGNGQSSPKYTVLSQFCCGGIANYLQWQITNQSKNDSKMMNSYFYDILYTLFEWNARQK